jgi:hypothetical protein
VERLKPLLAGVVEVIPWLKQWHNDLDPEFQERMGDFFETFLQGQLAALRLDTGRPQALDTACFRAAKTKPVTLINVVEHTPMRHVSGVACRQDKLALVFVLRSHGFSQVVGQCGVNIGLLTNQTRWQAISAHETSPLPEVAS